MHKTTLQLLDEVLAKLNAAKETFPPRDASTETFYAQHARIVEDTQALRTWWSTKFASSEPVDVDQIVSIHIDPATLDLSGNVTIRDTVPDQDYIWHIRFRTAAGRFIWVADYSERQRSTAMSLVAYQCRKYQVTVPRMPWMTPEDKTILSGALHAFI